MIKEDRSDRLPKELKGSICPFANRAKDKTRSTWIRIRTEGIVHAGMHRLQHTLLTIDRQLLTPSDRTDVIQPKGMVVVLMGQ